jgi:hypothetical protein
VALATGRLRRDGDGDTLETAKIEMGTVNPDPQMKKTGKARRSIWFIVVIVLISPFASCSYISHERNAAFNSVQIGDTRYKVINAFDAKFVSKPSGVAYTKYDTGGCWSPCVERLWFENILSMDIEAWSFDLDKEGRVVGKGKWNSP